MTREGAPYETAGGPTGEGRPAEPPPYAPAQPRYAGAAWARGAEDPRRKSPALASFLSAMPGLGQVYVGYYQRGFVHALVVATLITVLANSGHNAEIQPLGGLFLAFFWLYNIIDAGRRAAMYNLALAGGELLDPPQDLGLSGMRGSIVGGLLLVAAGGILLSHTAYGFSLDWLEEWWPAGLLILGFYLVVKGVLERRPA